MRATNGFLRGRGRGRGYFRYFQFVVLIWMSRRLERSPAIYRLASLFHSFTLYLFLLFFFSLSIFVVAVISSFSFRFVLSRQLFSIETFVCTHTLDPRRNLLIASFPDGREECTFPSRGNKWTWSRNWFSCPDDKDFSPRLFLTISSYVAFVRIAGKSDILCINWGCFNFKISTILIW